MCTRGSGHYGPHVACCVTTHGHEFWGAVDGLLFPEEIGRNK